MNLKKDNYIMENIKAFLNLVGIPLLVWVLLTLWNFNGDVIRLTTLVQTLTMKVDQMAETTVTRREFQTHKEQMDAEVLGIHGRMSSHDERIRELEKRR